MLSMQHNLPMEPALIAQQLQQQLAAKACRCTHHHLRVHWEQGNQILQRRGITCMSERAASRRCSSEASTACLLALNSVALKSR